MLVWPSSSSFYRQYYLLYIVVVYCPTLLLMIIGWSSNDNQGRVQASSLPTASLTESRLSQLSKVSSYGKKLRSKSLPLPLNRSNNINLVRPKFFVPTNLPINKETKVYIFNAEVKRFTFTINTKLEAPLTLTVTPCSHPIEWTFEFVEDIDAKELVSTRKRRRHGKHRQSHEDRLRRKRHRHDSKQLSTGQPSNQLLLAKHSGLERKSFTDIRRQYAGQYVIQLSSTARVTSCTLILSHFNPYPLLPVNDSLSVTSLTDSSATISWSPSLSEPDYPIDYFVTINQDHNLISYCEYLEQVESLTKYHHQRHHLQSSKINKSLTIETLVPLSTFMLTDEMEDENELENEVISSTATPFVRWWERTMAKTWESEQSRKNWTDFNIFHLEQANKTLNNRHTFASLVPLTRYFVDVIAVNRLTRGTSLYKGLNVTTKRQPKKVTPASSSSLVSTAVSSSSELKSTSLMPKVTKIRDKRLISVTLSSPNNFTELLSYNYNESELLIGGNLWLFVQICPTLASSKSSIDVTIQGANLTNSVMIREIGIKGSRVINIPMGLKWYNSTLKTGHAGQQKSDQHMMIVSLIGNSKLPLEVNLMITKKRSLIPYPQLPRDRMIRVLDLLTTCNSVSLAWIASPDEKARYCLYAAPVTEPNVTEQQLHQELNRLPGFNPNSTSTSHCESIKSLDSNNNLNKGFKSNPSSKSGNKGKHRQQLKSSVKMINVLDKSRYFKRLQCRRFRRLSENRLDQVIIHKVDSLRPSTEYVFLLEIVKSKGLTAYYNPITTATKSTQMC